MKTLLYTFSIFTRDSFVPTFACADRVKLRLKMQREDYFYKCYPNLLQYRRSKLLRMCKDCASELFVTLNTRTGKI